jgi:hypothetical protein
VENARMEIFCWPGCGSYNKSSGFGVYVVVQGLIEQRRGGVAVAVAEQEGREWIFEIKATELDDSIGFS